MTDNSSYIDMLRKFGSDLGLPKLNVDELLQAQKKNLEALGQSAKVAAQGAQSVAQKQREVLEAGLREASTLAREYKPLGKVHENLALQTEFARKMFDIAVKGADGSLCSSLRRRHMHSVVQYAFDMQKGFGSLAREQHRVRLLAAFQ